MQLMLEFPARYDDPDFPAENIEKVRSRFGSELFDEVRRVSGIVTDDEGLRYRLGKDLWRYQAAVRQSHSPINPAQRRELESLLKAAERFSKAIDRINDGNEYDINYEILYRPPFNARFYFREQQHYWDANENSLQRANDLAKKIKWSIERVFERRETEQSGYKRTKNTPLDHLIEDLTVAFEDGTGEIPKNHCHYSPSAEGYIGRYYDYVLLILKNFAPTSFHSEGALGKRIVRVLREIHP